MPSSWQVVKRMEFKTEKVSAEDEDFFLNPEFSFGKEEKVKYFDQLKRKYLATLETYKQVERQLGEVKEKVKVEKRGGRKKNLPGLDITNARFEEIKEDPTVPDGWKCAWRTMEGFSKGKRSRNFWAPNGKFFGSRVSAMRYMVVELGMSKSKDLETMRAGLLQDEWEEHPCLPKGWLCADETRPGDEEESGSALWRSKKFVTDTYCSLRNIRSAIKHMVVHRTEAEMATFLSGFSQKVSRILFWLHHPALPLPWHLAKTEVKDS